MPWVGLQCVMVVFPDHTHLLISCFFILNNQAGVIEAFNSTSRSLNDL